MAPKLHPRSKKMPPKPTSKSLYQQVVHPVQERPLQEHSSSGLDADSENKFELELCWCIQQLELGISSGKLMEKQLKNTQKNLNLLKRNTVSLIQKRQIMRNSFGDYRTKMLEEEKKYTKVTTSVKLIGPKSKDNKAVFIRKAQYNKNFGEKLENGSNYPVNDDNKELIEEFTEASKLSSLFNKSTVNNSFVFNFSQPG